MFEQYRKFVAPIEIEDDPEQTRIFALLNRMLLMFVYISGVFVFIGPLIFPGNHFSLIIFAILVGIWSLARYMARRGRLRYFSIGLVTVLWILTTGFIHMSGGLEGTPFALTYVAVVVIAGRLMGGRGGIVAMVLSFLSLILVVYLEKMGRLPPPIIDTAEVDEILLIGINLIVVTIFQYLAWRGEQDAIEKEHKLAEDAIAANNYKTELVMRVSHELRTPLGAVLGLADMMRAGEVGEISDKQKSILRRVVYNAEYLHHLVDDLLEQSQLISGELLLRKEPFSPADLAHRVVASLKSTAARKGIRLHLEGVETLPKTLIGDPERIVEIFTNLIENAIKYTEQGEVVTSARMLNDIHWQVVVRDTGPGIEPEFLDTIFEPFAQINEPILTRKQGGVGLGLTIVKQLVDMMNGTISVESELGNGSIFTVTLPIMRPQEAES